MANLCYNTLNFTKGADSMYNALRYSHQLLAETIERFPAGHYIDATLGNGHDTAFILTRPNFAGTISAFDIQSEALESARNLLRQKNLVDHPGLTLYKASHARITDTLTDIPVFHGAIYNLGYLPGGDHSVTTLAESTLTSLAQVRSKLVVKGRIILVIYYGHPGGLEEKDAILAELATWPQEQFQVLQYGFINQRNNPPLLVAVERLRDR